jgi:hypothetical protein
MTNIPLIVQLCDGCVIVGTLVSFQQNLSAPTFFDSAIHQLPEASCSVSVLTDTMGTLDFNARHVVKIGTDRDHMVEIKAAMDVVLYLKSLLALDRKVEGSVEQLLQQICEDAST